MNIFNIPDQRSFVSINNSQNLWKFFFMSFLLLAVHYQISLLSYKEWGDESETIITSIMMKEGYSLYDEIFESHGPLIFLPGMFIAYLSGFKILGYRIFIAVLQLLAIFSIYTSPLLMRFSKQIRTYYFIFALSALLLYFPKFYSHTFLYHNLVGIFLVFILSRYTFPSIAYCKINSRDILFGNVLIASLPFLGISFTPMAFFLFFSSLRKEYLSIAIFAAFSAVILNLLFLISIGSLQGFFVDHIYINTNLAPLFIPKISYPSDLIEYIGNIIHASRTNFSGIVTLILFCLCLLNLIFKCRYFSWNFLTSWRSIFIIIGLMTLLARGSDNHALPYYYACLTFFSTLNLDKFKFYKAGNWILGFLIFFIVLKMSFFFHDDKARFKKHLISYDTEFSKIVKTYTDNKDRILAYSWQNFEYLASERLPISGSSSYFPWQVAYNQNPVFGFNIDGCKDIANFLPKVMLVDKANFVSNYDWIFYGQCINNQLEKNYTKITDKPFYLRNDIAKKYFNEINL